MRVALVFAVLLLGIVSTPVKAGEGNCDPLWVEYEPQVIEVRGLLSIEAKYGPPNYGATPQIDRKEEIYVMNLERPISVRGTSEPNATTFECVLRVQIALTGDVKNFVGKSIVAKGRIFEGQTAHHYYDLVLSVLSVIAN